MSNIKVDRFGVIDSGFNAELILSENGDFMRYRDFQRIIRLVDQSHQNQLSAIENELSLYFDKEHVSKIFSTFKGSQIDVRIRKVDIIILKISEDERLEPPIWPENSHNKLILEYLKQRESDYYNLCSEDVFIEFIDSIIHTDLMRRRRVREPYPKPMTVERAFTVAFNEIIEKMKEV